MQQAAKLKTPELIGAWVEAINSANLDLLLGLYSDSAWLFPAFQTSATTSEERQEYYERLLAVSPHVQITKNAKAINHCEHPEQSGSFCGQFAFSFKQSPKIIDAHYWILISNNKIIHEHMSSCALLSQGYLVRGDVYTSPRPADCGLGLLRNPDDGEEYRGRFTWVWSGDRTGREPNDRFYSRDPGSFNLSPGTSGG